MTSRDRVIAVIEHRRPDRMPIYGWLKANLGETISREFGSVEAFEDRYEFDFAHLFGGATPYPKAPLEALREACGGMIEPADLLELELSDPDTEADYDGLRQALDHHKTQRSRFVYVQTPGIFECLNGPFGIENHLMYLALYPSELHRVYRRQAEWNRRFAMNCLDLGVDMIHVSDDWGGQHALMFAPETWRRLILPHHKITADAVKDRGAFLSLHSDGNVSAVMDGILSLGYDVLHPWQESAGMSLERFRQDYRDRLTVMGGLDVQTAIGFGDLDRVRREIERVMRMFSEGGLLFCTSHYVQAHCSMEELKFAFDAAYELSRSVCR
jgi:uroporphyrinogen decarboxylase